MNKEMWKFIVEQAYLMRIVVCHTGENEVREVLTVCDKNMEIAHWVFDKEADTITLESVQNG